MSKPRFKLYAEVDTLAHANTIKTNVQIQLVGKDIFEQHSFSIIKGDELNSSKIILLADWRFNNSIDRDSLKDWVKDQIQNNPQVKNWVLVSKLSWHICTHDDISIKNCRETFYGEFLK